MFDEQAPVFQAPADFECHPGEWPAWTDRPIPFTLASAASPEPTGPTIRRSHYTLGGRSIAFDLVIARPLEWVTFEGREDGAWLVLAVGDRVIAWRALDTTEAPEPPATWPLVDRHGAIVGHQVVMTRDAWQALPLAERPAGHWSEDGRHLCYQCPADPVGTTLRTVEGGPLAALLARYEEAQAKTARAFAEPDEPSNPESADREAERNRAQILDDERQARTALVDAIAAAAGYRKEPISNARHNADHRPLVAIREGNQVFCLRIEDAPDEDGPILLGYAPRPIVVDLGAIA